MNKLISQALSKKCLFPNPHLNAGVLTARVGVISSTIFWAILVIYDPHAFVRENYHFWAVIGEDVWATGFMAIALVKLYRTWCHYPPSTIGFLMSSALAFLWTDIALGNFLRMNEVPIGGLAACLTMMLFSWWNLVELPKKGSELYGKRFAHSS
jgi:hypothetical protein